MKLHYSQTANLDGLATVLFQYLMKLHYSQTIRECINFLTVVSVPYEITLLSNLK